MNKYILITESGTDMPLDLAEKHHINVLPMHVVMDGIDYLDGSISVNEIYSYYKRTKKIPTTSATNPYEYEKFFKEMAKKYPDKIIIYIGYSSKASCTFKNACIASEGIKNIHLIDSLNVTGGEAAIILKAAEIIEQEPDVEAEELVKRIETYVKRARVSFIPGNLEYLKAGGRVSNAAYLGATILQLKPLIEIIDGELISTKKYRGAMSHVAENYLNEYLSKYNFDKKRIHFLYSLGLDEDIKMHMEEIAKEKGFQEIMWFQTGCVISTHSGPGAIGIAGFEI